LEYDLDVCYNCERLFTVEVTNDENEESLNVMEGVEQLDLCPSCNAPGYDAKVIEYYSPDSDKRESTSMIHQLGSKVFSRLKEPDYICYCPKCGRHRLMLYLNTLTA
jgi:hypothetical protein